MRKLLTLCFLFLFLAAVVGCGGKNNEGKDLIDDLTIPDGYKLVWHDEFDEGSEPGANWWYETGDGGWGNNELQHYVAGKLGEERLATVKDGVLTITAQKIDGKIYSIRMNTVEGWQYGYFEARLRLPVGKGTWPAFWMMPKNFTAWPDDGEIDIMEEVGYNPDYVSSSIHCKSYYHTIGTQKTKEVFLPGAQTEFHVYALEWTADFIRTFVDGRELFYFPNDKMGNKDTWPFDAPFYLKLNLAWGGNWGGARGVDESVLPATYDIDYIRVFQKK
ncbi:MAG: glycoside hydrolase family 16 protein [Massilibacteroides sp.]|nr:glycoside hydrolase family 16 protein [Massilibacteroides sp.]MDD3062026.1 glycoside hydrolase family 16 protein [Massilibacteroides sp.]MDD4114839.1 glycoside hydrolase family 16 protein [Massilibacteroides sp.]MDD4659257.1 glycoside hydrolase family 16 protein [Massilibacteroides sp.]